MKEGAEGVCGREGGCEAAGIYPMQPADCRKVVECGDSASQLQVKKVA